MRRLRRQRDLLYKTNWGKGGEKEPLIYLWECDGDEEDAWILLLSLSYRS